MTDTVPMTFDELVALAETVVRNEAEFAFICVAIQWAEEANKEVSRLRTENDGLIADVCNRSVMLDNVKAAIDTMRQATLIDDWPTFDRIYKEVLYGNPTRDT